MTSDSDLIGKVIFARYFDSEYVVEAPPNEFMIITGVKTHDAHGRPVLSGYLVNREYNPPRFWRAPIMIADLQGNYDYAFHNHLRIYNDMQSIGHLDGIARAIDLCIDPDYRVPRKASYATPVWAIKDAASM